MNGYEYLKNFLDVEGYKIKDEEEGHFSFKFQGTIYVAFKNDAPYLQIVVMCNTREFDFEKVLRVCNELNGDKFVTKFVALEKTVWVSYEFMPNYATTNDEFQMILEVLNRNSDELFQRLTNEEE